MAAVPHVPSPTPSSMEPSKASIERRLRQAQIVFMRYDRAEEDEEQRELQGDPERPRYSFTEISPPHGSGNVLDGVQLRYNTTYLLPSSESADCAEELEQLHAWLTYTEKNKLGSYNDHWVVAEGDVYRVASARRRNCLERAQAERDGEPFRHSSDGEGDEPVITGGRSPPGGEPSVAPETSKEEHVSSEEPKAASLATPPITVAGKRKHASS